MKKLIFILLSLFITTISYSQIPDTVFLKIKSGAGNIDSLNVSKLNGGKIDTSHIPISNIYISQLGAGVSTLRGSNDTLHSSNIQGTGTVTVTKQPDSSILITGSAGGSVSIQEITTGTAATVSAGTTWVIINPSTAIGTFSLTMPASPTNGQVVDISFGGTISSADSTVVTTFTVIANTGQNVVGGSYALGAITEDKISYRYYNTNWYKN